MLVPPIPIAHAISSNHIVPQQKTTRNKKAYAKFILGAMVTAAATGCFFGGLRVAIGSKECYQNGNYMRAVGNVIFGPLLFGLSIPLGEAGLKLAKNGLVGLWQNEEENPIKTKKETKGKS